MNTVMISRILELSESRSRLYRLKRLMSNWKYVVVMSLSALTLKVMAEQLVMLIR